MKKKKITIKKVWQLFSKYIRQKWAVNDICECITCDQPFHVKKIQAGHFISRRYLNTIFDEQNVMPQCYRCNVLLHGQQWLFGKKLDLMFGNGTAEKLYNKSLIKKKFTPDELKTLYTELQEKLK